MKWLLFFLLPKNLVSRLVGRLARWESPAFLVQPVKTWFANRYHLDMNEAEKTMEEYLSLNALFTRKLKAGLRPIESEVIHPCDAVISQTGPIENGQILQVKGWTYSVEELIGEPLTDDLRQGSFATYYLCPTDYHRVHAPISGYLTKVTHRVGKLWPVNEWSVHNVKNLFCQNERVIFKLKTQQGPVFLVMVGATNVGQMTSAHVPELRTNVTPIKATTFDFSTDPKPIEVGEEIGVFEMGSTVVMVFPKNLSKKLKVEIGSVKLGQTLLAPEIKKDWY